MQPVVRSITALALLFTSAVQAVPRTVTQRPPLGAEELANIQLFEDSSPSVVHITTIAYQRDIFSFNVTQIPQGTGTGFVWDDRGHIVTNFHVIQGGDEAKVTLADRSTWPAKLVGAAPEKDLAVLRITAQAKQLKPLAIGTSSDLKVGQKVFAIGNPFGLDQSLTTGIISALGREIDSVTNTPIKDVIQTDAAINPGNSGGPLLDSASRLIGVNTAIYSPSGAYAGIGFAIPVDTVNWVVSELITYGKLTRPSLGISVASEQLMWRWNLPGVLVMEVEEGGSADRAGIRGSRRTPGGGITLGDLILAIDDTEISSGKELFQKIIGYKVGEKVTLTIRRERETLKIPVTLRASSASPF